MSTALITQKDARFINNYDKILMVRYYFYDLFGKRADMIVHGFAKMAEQFRKASKIIVETWIRFARENKDILEAIKEEE